MLINLDPAFQPYGAGEDFKSWLFSGGEIGFKLPIASKYTSHRYLEKVIITTRLTYSEKVMQLLMATDAIKRYGWKDIELHMPYVPYARQDRVMVPGESLSLKVFADLINSQGYSKVLVYDIHNISTLGLFNNIENISATKFGKFVIQNQYRVYQLICPDYGALKRVSELAKALNYKRELVVCEKVRDVNTGEITHTKVNGEIEKGIPCFIYDDIADGARTFVEIAKVLKEKGAGIVSLIVSHGIFSKGFNLPGIDRIFVTNSFRDIVSDNVTQIKLDSGFLS